MYNTYILYCKLTFLLKEANVDIILILIYISKDRYCRCEHVKINRVTAIFIFINKR